MSFFTFIFILIIISLFNRLMEGAKSESSQGQTQQRQQQQHEQERRKHPLGKISVEKSSPDLARQEKLNNEQILSLEEQREKQLEKLASRMNAAIDVEEDSEYQEAMEAPRVKRKTFKHQPVKKKEKIKKRVSKRLDRDGLVDSVIMAEVLGRPRALRPYENILMRK